MIVYLLSGIGIGIIITKLAYFLHYTLVEAKHHKIK